MDLLQDPKNDRQVPTLPAPPHQRLSDELLYPPHLNGRPDWRMVRDHLHREGRISKAHLIQLVNQCNNIMKNEGNVLYVQDPLTLVGDIHGQFYDLIKVLQMGGDPDVSRYVFLGDFVDRGSFSIEVVLLLYAMKIYYPKEVFLLRGNHECRQMTSYFNFRDECKYKYDQEVYEIIMDSFHYMPLMGLINGKFLCLHGGISPEFKTLADVERIDRFKEPPTAGLFCDILWADPIESDEIYTDIQYRGNEVRGCSWFFGRRAVEPLLQANGFICIIRAHEAQLEGYRLYNYNDKTKEFPQIMTVFSAPNYCDVYNNKAAILRFENSTLNIQQFNYAQHPYLLPHFLDIFSWSVPFVSEKITEMLHYMMTPKEGENLSDDDEEQDKQVIRKLQTIKEETIIQTKKKHADITKNKIKFISRMALMQKTLRKEHENIIKLKGLCPDNRIPKGVLIQGAEGIKDAIAQFNKAKKADQINEKRPDEQQIQTK